MDDFIAWSNCETCKLAEAITTVGSEISSIQSEQSTRIVQTSQFQPKIWFVATWENMLGVGRGLSPSRRHLPLLAGNTLSYFLFNYYSQLSPCGHLAIKDTLDIWTAAKSPSKNKLQTFDWNKFPLLKTFTIKDTNSRSRGCPQ